MGNRKFWDNIMHGMDLDGEPRPGQPLLELMGTERVLIENHCGLLEYGEARMCVKVKRGQILVCGNNLSLALMSRERLIICGCIDSVQMIRG